MAKYPRKMNGVREYAEEMTVELDINKNGRLIIRAYNEAGCNCTEVDLLDVTDWIYKNQILIQKALVKEA